MVIVCIDFCFVFPTKQHDSITFLVSVLQITGVLITVFDMPLLQRPLLIRITNHKVIVAAGKLSHSSTFRLRRNVCAFDWFWRDALRAVAQEKPWNAPLLAKKICKKRVGSSNGCVAFKWKYEWSQVWNTFWKDVNARMLNLNLEISMQITFSFFNTKLRIKIIISANQKCVE